MEPYLAKKIGSQMDIHPSDLISELYAYANKQLSSPWQVRSTVDPLDTFKDSVELAIDRKIFDIIDGRRN